MLRRILMLVTVAAVMLTMSVAPAFAGILEPCKNNNGIAKSGGKAQCEKGKHKGPTMASASVVNLTSVTSSANAASVGVGAPLLVIGGLLAYRMVNSKR